MGIVESIRNKDFAAARDALDKAVALIMERKLLEVKKRMCAEMKLDGFKPSNNIEDRRGPVVTDTMNKTDRADTQVTTSGLKGDKESGSTSDLKTDRENTTTIKKTVNEEELTEARIKIIKARIRNGKIQRRKKVANVPGMTLRGGKLTRMSPAERRKRKMGARKAKVKRKTKMARTLMKRKRSLQKRKNLGL